MILTAFKPEYMIYLWLAIAVLALIIETITTDFTSIWASASAVITMIVAIFVDIIWLQVLIFALLTILFIICIRPYIRRYFKRNEIKTNFDALIGKVGIVNDPIEPLGKGSVKIEGKEWTAISDENVLIDHDSRVVIIAIEGVKLLVKPVNKN